MRLRDANVADIASGIFVLSLGVAVIWIASGYPLGTAHRLGPGAFPIALGIILVILGAAILLPRARAIGPLPEARARPFGAVLAGLLAFAFTVESLGLVPATVSLVLLSSLASYRASLRVALISALVLSIGGVILFEHLLAMPLHAFAW